MGAAAAIEKNTLEINETIIHSYDKAKLKVKTKRNVKFV